MSLSAWESALESGNWEGINIVSEGLDIAPEERWWWEDADQGISYFGS